MPRGPWTEEQRAKIMESKRKAKEAREAKEVMPSDERSIKSDTRPVSATRASTVEVIYRPFPDEPHTTIWHGIKFRANVPVLLDRNNPAHSYEQLLPRHITGPNGEVLTKHVPTMVFMGEIAKGNPAFEVDGHRARKLVSSRVVPPPGAEWTEAHEGQISESHQLDEVD